MKRTVLLLCLSAGLAFAWSAGPARPIPSAVAFELDEIDLIPEGIAHDSATGRFFIGSVAKEKIVSVDASGKASDFVVSRRDGLRRVLGLKVDAERRRLWALSNETGRPQSASFVHVFDADSGRLLAMLRGPSDHATLFNDLVLTLDGAAYITDSRGSALLRVTADLDRLEPFLSSDGAFDTPNGVAVSGDDFFLYVASDSKGIILVDLRTKASRPISPLTAADTRGIDGLMLFKTSLVGIVNGVEDFSRHRIDEFRLDAAGTGILSIRTIDEKNPLFFAPTTGVIVEGTLFCLARTCVHLFAKEKITDAARLQKPLVLKYKLD